jgi:hypothetical protein
MQKGHHRCVMAFLHILTTGSPVTKAVRNIASALAYHKPNHVKEFSYGRKEASRTCSQKRLSEWQNSDSGGIYQPLDQNDQSD